LLLRAEEEYKFASVVPHRRFFLYSREKETDKETERERERENNSEYLENVAL